MKKGWELAASARRASMKRAMAMARKQREKRFPKPKIVGVSDQPSNADAEDRKASPQAADPTTDGSNARREISHLPRWAMFRVP